MGDERSGALPGPKQPLVLQVLIDPANCNDAALQIPRELPDGRKQRTLRDVPADDEGPQLRLNLVIQRLRAALIDLNRYSHFSVHRLPYIRGNHTRSRLLSR
ncbi:hypothetical protein D3C75_1043480 [compost metagenome]